MGLTALQKAALTKVRAAGGEVGIALDDGVCTFLLATVARDLDMLSHFPELPASFPRFFTTELLSTLQIEGLNFRELFERLIARVENADTYFFCLATLHKARLKYEHILQAQKFPEIEQVGPRGLLQYGSMSNPALAAFLFWRKWMFDIDNRAGQETGYLFEPILTAAIGGTACSAQTSPVRRAGTGAGRQVDCIHDQKAYEFKIRVTIAASGQGRWREELAFPADCRASGYTPVLVVLDSTANPKLSELTQAFLHATGEVYIGPNAWTHLNSLAGPSLARLLQIYVHTPLQSLLAVAPNSLPEPNIPSLCLEVNAETLTISIGDERLDVRRTKGPGISATPDVTPEDNDNALSGS